MLIRSNGLGGGCKAQHIEACSLANAGDGCLVASRCTAESLKTGSCQTCVAAAAQTGAVARVTFYADCDNGATAFGDALEDVQLGMLRHLKATLLTECRDTKVRYGIVVLTMAFGLVYRVTACLTDWT